MNPHRSMFIKRSDLPVPRPWWWWAALLLLVIHQSRRNQRALHQVGVDLAEVTVTRWEETDEATTDMLKMTQTMVRLTWAVVALTIVVVGATLYLGLR